MYVVPLGFDETDDPNVRIQIEPPLTEDCTVSELRLRVAELLKKPSEDFNLMYCGEILTDESATLALTRIRPKSSTVHVIPKPKVQPQSTSLNRWKDPENNHETIKKFVVSFTHMVHCNLLESASHRLKKRENLDDLIATCPDLAQDPLALSMLSHPDLLSHCLLNPEVALKISGEHPALLEACQNLAVAAHEEKLLSRPERDQMNEAFMEASDGEDDDGPADQPEGNRMVGITADQLANALLQAQQGGPTQGASSSSGPRNPQADQESQRNTSATQPQRAGPSSLATSPNAESLFAQRSPYSQLPPLGPGPSRPPSMFNQTPIFGQLPYPASVPSRPSGSGSSGITQAQLSAALASTFASRIAPPPVRRQLSPPPLHPPGQILSLAQVLAEALAQSLASAPPPAGSDVVLPMDLTNAEEQPPDSPQENDERPNPEDNPE